MQSRGEHLRDLCNLLFSEWKMVRDVLRGESSAIKKESFSLFRSSEDRVDVVRQFGLQWKYWLDLVINVV